MGIFGGGDDDAAQESAELMNEQIRQNQAELEAKRQKLYEETLDIIKGQGQQVWQADRSAKAPARSPTNGKMPFFGDKFRL